MLLSIFLILFPQSSPDIPAESTSAGDVSVTTSAGNWLEASHSSQNITRYEHQFFIVLLNLIRVPYH